MAKTRVVGERKKDNANSTLLIFQSSAFPTVSASSALDTNAAKSKYTAFLFSSAKIFAVMIVEIEIKSLSAYFFLPFASLFRSRSTRKFSPPSSDRRWRLTRNGFSQTFDQQQHRSSLKLIQVPAFSDNQAKPLKPHSLTSNRLNKQYQRWERDFTSELFSFSPPLRSSSSPPSPHPSSRDSHSSKSVVLAPPSLLVLWDTVPTATAPLDP